jgi:predicted transcriptional regulator
LGKGPDRLKSRSPGDSPDTIETGRLQIGARLKHARILAGVLMRELAAKVDCTESMISKIESGRVMPSLPMLQRIWTRLAATFLLSSARIRVHQA